MKKILILVFFAVAPISIDRASAQEGMWPLNMLPEQTLQNEYEFSPTQIWITTVQNAAVRLPRCSASFVSENGLVITNGHCVEDVVQQLSTADSNLYETGFYAQTQENELKTELTLLRLQSIEDVTSAVNEATDRSQVIKKIEQESSEITSLKCEVVTLYNGALYQTYCYKEYTDVRLVFSAEKNAWFFGGEADNFEFPRFVLDVAFLRAYEDSKPAHIEHYFGWSRSGASENDLVVVGGHPGRTKRGYTVEALKTERDVVVPFILNYFLGLEIAVQQFALEGGEAKRISKSDLFRAQNIRKFYLGNIQGLFDPQLLKEKKQAEAQLIRDAEQNEKMAFQLRKGLQAVAQAQETFRQWYAKKFILSYSSRYSQHSKEEVSNSISQEYQTALLEYTLIKMIEVYGADHPFIVKALSGFGPQELSRKLIFQNTEQPSVSFQQAIKEETQNIKSLYSEAELQQRQGYTDITHVLFELYGKDRYPDATFTLRLAFGRVQSYQERGEMVGPWTTLGRAFEHARAHGNQGDWQLPLTWQNNKERLNLETPLNFVATIDITGGNSGSPVFNQNLEIVGIVFDGNIYMPVNDYDYNYNPLARAIAVDSRGIIELLDKTYNAQRLIQELFKTQP